MPRSRPLRSSFNAGVFSPRLQGRVDLARYPAAAEVLQNFFCFPEGGITRRPGSRYIAAAPGKGRLLPFSFNTEQSYVLEHTDRLIRFYTGQGRIVTAGVGGGIINGDFSQGLTGWDNLSTGDSFIDLSGGTQRLAGSVGTSIGNMTGSSGVEGPFDSSIRATTASRSASSTGWVGKDWGPGVTKRIVGFEVYGSTDFGCNSGGSVTLVARCEASNSSNFQDFVTLGTVQFRNRPNVTVFSKGLFDASTGYRYCRLRLTGGSSDRTMFMSGLRFVEASASAGGHLALSDRSFGTAIAEQAFATPDVGVEHVLVFSLVGVVTNRVDVKIGTTSQGGEVFPNATFTTGHHMLAFTPTTTTSFLSFTNREADTVFLGDVRVLGSGQTGHVPIELPSPFLESEIKRSTYLQFRDILWLVHERVPPQQLIRRGNADWSIQPVQFSDGPYLDENLSQSRLITPSASTGTITLTASTSIFSRQHIGSVWRIGPPGGVPGYSLWEQGDSISDGEYRQNEGSVYRATSSGTAGNSPPVHEQGTVNDGGVDWRFANRGGWGWVVIIDYTSSTQVTAVVRQELDSVAVAEGTSVWRESAFSNVRGWPNAIALYSNRIVYGKELTLFMSVIGGYSEFTPGDFDDDGVTLELGGEQSNVIQWMIGAERLLVGTAGGPWVVRASREDEVITPSNAQARLQSSTRCAPIEAIRADSQVLFIARGGRKIHELSYSFQNDAYVAPDLTYLAENILQGGCRRLAFAEEPDSQVLALREDGLVAALTYDRAEETLAWALWKIGGSFGDGHAVVESLLTIPGSDESIERDEIWMMIRRTVNGEEVYHVEVLEEAMDEESTYRDALFPDSHLVYDGVPTNALAGFDHLEGETVQVLVDGGVQPDVVVSDGQIQLQTPGSYVVAGLPQEYHYRSWEFPEGANTGPALGVKSRPTHITVGFINSSELSVGTGDGQLVPAYFREARHTTGQPVELFTGVKRIALPSSWSRSTRVEIRGSGPLPLTVTYYQIDRDVNEFS